MHAMSFRPANLSLISFETSTDQRKTAFALNRLAINLGMSIGPVIGGFLTQIDYTFLFYGNGISTILSGVFLSVIKIEHGNNSKVEQALIEKPINS